MSRTCPNCTRYGGTPCWRCGYDASLQRMLSRDPAERVAFKGAIPEVDA